MVPVANGTEPMEAVITIDILRRAGADVTVASVEEQLRVDACHGVKIAADAVICDCADTLSLSMYISISKFWYFVYAVTCISMNERYQDWLRIGVTSSERRRRQVSQGMYCN